MSKQASKKTAVSSPIVAIYQWLSYAFWGWVAIVSAILIGIATNFSLDGYGPNYEATAYVIAAALVVLPIAFIADVLFSRHEQDHKTSGGMVIMVIHAVLYSLVAVGGLAMTMFFLVSLVLTNETDLSGIWVGVVVSAVVFVTFALLTLRIMRPSVGSPLRLIIRLSLTAIVLAGIIWGLVGPVAQTVQRKGDERVISAVLSTGDMVSGYVASNGALPTDIDQLLASPQADSYGVSVDAVRWAVDEERLSYTPNVRPAVVSDNSGTSIEVFAYELCATYEYFDENRSERVMNTIPRIGSIEDFPADFMMNPPTLRDDAGQQCYKLLAENYNKI